jgi:hypothetical protein
VNLGPNSLPVGAGGRQFKPSEFAGIKTGNIANQHLPVAAACYSLADGLNGRMSRGFCLGH